MINFYKATDQQLETIFNHECDLPTDLLVGLVEEMMKRELFDGMIMHMAKRIRNVPRNEIIQAAYIGIYQLAKIFKPGKLSFKQMVYISIERRIKNLLQAKYTHSAQLMDNALQNDVPILPAENNVEKFVIQKMVMQEQIKKLNKKERFIIQQFLKGYSIKSIAERFFKQDPVTIHYHFKKALKKMDITDFKLGKRGGFKDELDQAI